MRFAYLQLQNQGQNIFWLSPFSFYRRAHTLTFLVSYFLSVTIQDSCLDATSRKTIMIKSVFLFLGARNPGVLRKNLKVGEKMELQTSAIFLFIQYIFVDPTQYFWHR